MAARRTRTRKPPTELELGVVIESVLIELQKLVAALEKVQRRL